MWQKCEFCVGGARAAHLIGDASAKFHNDRGMVRG